MNTATDCHAIFKHEVVGILKRISLINKLKSNGPTVRRCGAQTAYSISSCWTTRHNQRKIENY